MEVFCQLEQTDTLDLTNWIASWQTVAAYINLMMPTMSFLQVHGPDRTVRETAESGEGAGLLQQPERVRLCGRVPAAAHLRLPAARA